MGGDDRWTLAFTAPFGSNRQLSGQLASDFQKTFAHRRIDILNQDRHPFITALAQCGCDRNLPQEGDLESFRGLLRPATGKNVMFLVTAVTDKLAHILDQADARDHHLVEHRFGSNHVGESDMLRRRDQDRAAHLELL